MSSQNQIFQRLSWVDWIWVLIGGFILSGCSGRADRALEPVDVQLKWVHQAQFAGFYAGEKEGYYAEEDIDVTLHPGGHLSPEQIIDQLVESDVDFAVVGGDQLIAARFRGEPVVAIAVIFQKNPYVYASLEESGIQRPHDLMGKKVMVPPDADVIHRALMEKLEVNLESIEHVPYERDTTPLMSEEIDAHLVYRTGLGLALEETGADFNWMWVNDYGVHFYADTIVTREVLIQENPELVKRFLQATIKGWRYAIENPAHAVDLTLQYDSDLTRDRQARMVEAQTPLIHTGEVKIGWMERDVWKSMQQMLIEQDVLAIEDIERKANQTAQNMASYIHRHPDMTLEELQDDPQVWDIAVQTVGETGYTVVADAATGRPYFHPHPDIVGEDPSQSREAFPSMWEIIDRTIGTTCQDASGFYEWSADGESREKYTQLVCVDAETDDGKRLFVGASTFLDDYDLKKTDVDSLFTMRFLSGFYEGSE